MSRFYGSIQGASGEATRCGHANSGYYAHIRGWNVGARVELHAEGDVDVVRVYRTGGSNDPHGTLIAEFRSDD